MRNRGWQRVTHPNLQGLGFTNGRQVISDLGPEGIYLGDLDLLILSFSLNLNSYQICRNRVENLERIKKAKINKY